MDKEAGAYIFGLMGWAFLVGWFVYYIAIHEEE